MPPAPAIIRSIYRYPVKGLSAQALTRVALGPGDALPADRIYAIENGPSGFDPASPSYFPKHRFLMLMRNERLAGLRSTFEEHSHVLAIESENRMVARGDLRTTAGRLTIEAFFRRLMTSELRGPPKVLHAPGHSFSDVAKKVVSIINLASIAEIETVAGAAVDPLRFRGNIYLSGWPPWHEFSLLQRQFAIGPTAQVRIVKRIQRCAATDVDPLTAIRDMAIPKTLMKNFGHADCGVYAEVIAGGEIGIGYTLTPVEPS